MELDWIINLSYEKFVENLKDIAKDSKVRALINAGRKDGLPNDEKIVFGMGVVPANGLIPMQQELLLEKSVKWAIIGHDMNIVVNVLKGLPLSNEYKPVVTLNGKYIIDGHHRWTEVYSLNPNARITVYDMKINIKPIDAFKIIQLAIAATVDDIPFSNSEGTNLYKADASVIKNFIMTNIVNKVVDAMKIPKEDCVNLIVNNILQLRKNNPPSPDAPNRLYMPQPSKAPGYDDKLKSGEINFKKPFVKEMMNNFDRFLMNI